MSLHSLPIGTVTLSGHTYHRVTAVTGRYQEGDGLAVMLYSDGEPLASLTTNVPGDPRTGPLVWAKDYSENEGLVDSLTALGLAKRTGRTVSQGFVELPEIELLGALALAGSKATAPGQPN